MDRPYIICHMVTSIDSKVTGDFLFRPECESATELYYLLNRNMISNGFICGRVTMESSFTGGWYPELSAYEPMDGKEDFIAGNLSGNYAVAFDTNGKLGWKTDRIVDPDGDPGYDGAQIIEVLSENVDGRYLAYLRETGISYIFAGENEIDVNTALKKLKDGFGCEILLLEGGSIINGAFQRAGAIDELCLVAAPVIADKDSKPLFTDGCISDFRLVQAVNRNGNLLLSYKKI